jgi:hypothetical protein
MQTTTDSSSTIPATVNETVAQRAADTYLFTTVAPGIETATPVLVSGDRSIWRMRVCVCQREPTASVGTIDVDAQTGQVLPLTSEEVEDMRDRLKEHTGKAKGLVRPRAQMNANGYLADHVSLSARADRPVFVADDRPVWRATVFLRLRGHGRVCDLGVIDMDAQTGEVVPLSQKQLQAMRKRARDAAERTTLAATTTVNVWPPVRQWC